SNPATAIAATAPRAAANGIRVRAPTVGISSRHQEFHRRTTVGKSLEFARARRLGVGRRRSTATDSSVLFQTRKGVNCAHRSDKPAQFRSSFSGEDASKERGRLARNRAGGQLVGTAASNRRVVQKVNLAPIIAWRGKPPPPRRFVSTRYVAG